MEIVSQDGVGYRTQLMLSDNAARFAKALEANSRFTSVSVQESTRTQRDKRWFVMFAPSNPDRVQDLLDRQHAAREQRALTQEFTFVRDPDHPYYHCFSHSSG